MVALMMSSAFAFILIAFAGVSVAEDGKRCVTDQVTVLSHMVGCVTKNHPEYFLTVLTKMNNPAAMEKPDFMCSNQGMMSAFVDCFLEYVEGCMPSGVASQVASVMPSHQNVLRGVKFLCDHKKDFEHACVKEQVMSLFKCFSTKMAAFSRPSLANQADVHNTLCSALRTEEQCLASTLTGCPAAVASDLMSGLLSFFPHQNCHIKDPRTNKVLKFESELNHNH